MKLRKLILAGFKSFADRTEFEFHDGVSCVVGPNGCGKSNVVDAIKWVLGEQSAKSLRGSEMLDVIFNGSVARKAAGVASVTLEFDNSEGKLKPIGTETEQYKSISITRRLYRSGQSEYQINQKPARLRDIKDMFLDTGLGGSAYSIIEQGRISQFLQATQDERRAFFDEAAGISRYKARRKEALRKLDRVEQNVFRLTDILAEVEKQLRSIKYQAGKARNYQSYSAELKELKSLYFLSKYHLYTNDRKQLETALSAGTEHLATIQSRITQIQESQRASEIEAGELETTCRDFATKVATLNEQIQSLKHRIEMQTQRLEELDLQLQNNTLMIEDFQQKLEACIEDLESKEAELQKVLTEVEELEIQCDTLRDQHAEEELALSNQQNQLEDEKNQIVELVRTVTQKHNDAHAAGVKRISLHDERLRLENRLLESANQIDQLEEQKQQIVSRKAEFELAVENSQAQQEELQLQLSTVADDERNLNSTLTQTRQKRSSLEGRMHTLHEMQKRMEGVAKGPKRILEAVAKNQLTSIEGLLGGYIETDVENSVIVEAALAGADQYLVAKNSDAVQQEAQTIKEVLGKGGNAEIICINQTGKINQLTAPANTVGCARDLVRSDSSIAGALDSLLGNTYIVEDLATAYQIKSTADSNIRLVTKSGEVLEPDGRIRIGAGNKTSGFITRKSELAELEKQATELDKQIDELDQQCLDTREMREHLDQMLQAIRTEIYQNNYEKNECDKQIRQLDNQINHKQNELPRFNNTLSNLRNQIEDVITYETQSRKAANDAEQQKGQRDSMIGQLEQQLIEAREKLAVIANQRNEMRVVIAAAQQRKISLTDTVASLQRRQEETRSQLASAKENIELDGQRRADSQEEIARCQEQIIDLTEQLETNRIEFAEAEESRQSLNSRLTEVRQTLAEKRDEADRANQQVGDLRVKLSQIDAHLGDLVNRASDEMQMNLAELYPDYEHDSERDWNQVEQDMNSLRGKIGRLGNVNLDAIEEQQELEQRQKYLEEQLADVTDAKKELEALIEKINQESQERFTETFGLVRENFQNLFRKLFGGGKADIFLEDPEDVLESGIEIVARPPGKELRSISLLSGGEKTMAALAMIFAFFQAKPSPFCLLDEVDAALDEANTERYNTLVSEFIGHTQFIMISHAKRTMSMADVLYGVTMQERGVSKRISVRFEQADQIDEVLEPVAS